MLRTPADTMAMTTAPAHANKKAFIVVPPVRVPEELYQRICTVTAFSNIGDPYAGAMQVHVCAPFVKDMLFRE
jgi:hypothetical protein